MNAPTTTAPLATKAATRRAGELGVELGDMQSAGRKPNGANEKYTVDDVEAYAEAIGKLDRSDPGSGADAVPADERGIDAVPEPDPETGEVAEAPPADDEEAEVAALDRVAELEARLAELTRQVEERGVAPVDVVKADSENPLDDHKPAELMPERSHLAGCPAPSNRVEAYKAMRPARVDNGIVVEPAHEVTMLHCIECGQTVQLQT